MTSTSLMPWDAGAQAASAVHRDDPAEASISSFSFVAVLLQIFAPELDRLDTDPSLLSLWAGGNSSGVVRAGAVPGGWATATAYRLAATLPFSINLGRRSGYAGYFQSPPRPTSSLLPELSDDIQLIIRHAFYGRGDFNDKSDFVARLTAALGFIKYRDLLNTACPMFDRTWGFFVG